MISAEEVEMIKGDGPQQRKTDEPFQAAIIPLSKEDKIKLFGMLSEALQPGEIVNALVLHKLSPEMVEIKKALLDVT